MQTPWLTLTLALTLTWTRTSAHCPDACSCSSGKELEYTCMLAGGSVTITASIRDYMNIDCEGRALTCSDFPSLPIAGNRSLPSLFIRECSLPDPLACIARKLDASGVDLLLLKKVSTPLERWHVEGLGTAKLFMFDAGAQTSVPSDALAALPTLRRFRLCGGNVTLTGQDFRHAPPLIYLELGNDNLTMLPADAFQGLGELKTLNIWGNNISEIHEDALRGLGALENVFVSGVQVRALPPRLLAHAAALRALALEDGVLRALPAALLRTLARLGEVTITNDAPLTLEPLAFANLPLTELKLADAGISSLPSSLLLNCTFLVNLTLAGNSIAHLPDMFEGLVALERLDLSNNRIARVSNKLFLGLKALRELNMDGNLLEVLPEYLFSGLRRLESVSMNSNRLHRVHPDAFQGASLLHLRMSHNALTFAEPFFPQYDNLEQFSPFNNQPRLRTLMLSRNRISKIFFDWRYVLVDLEELDLTYNSFDELTFVDVQFLSSRVKVDLRYNNISTIYLSDGYLAQETEQEPSETSAAILLDGNPLHCDCRLYNLAWRLRGARPSATEPKLLLDKSTCVSPPSLQGHDFATVPLDQFVCDVDCPCQCQIRPYINALDLICSNDTNIPDPRKYGLPHSILKLTHMPRDLSVLPDYISVLNLTDLGLKTAPDSVPKTLDLIDLTHNELGEFPVKLLAMNMSLKLSGNPFVCECSAVREIALMNKHSKKILDWQSLKCKDGSYLWRLEVEKLCLVQRATILGSVLAAIGLILAIAAVLMHRYAVEIRIFLSNRGCCFVDDYDASKKYDVFVSFAHEDEAFVVETLLPRLELQHKVCVHHRDWRVGELIPAQIASSVQESRRTLVVLSRRFLASAWGMLEFRAAHVQAARERCTRVVVLLLEDLAGADMDAELRAYLATNTYVKWGDQWFWEKLQHALPRHARRDRDRGGKLARAAPHAALHAELTPDGKLVNTALQKSAL